MSASRVAVALTTIFSNPRTHTVLISEKNGGGPGALREHGEGRWAWEGPGLSAGPLLVLVFRVVR